MGKEQHPLDDPNVEAVIQGKQSPSWHKYQDSEDFIEKGFPFNEGFPKTSPLSLEPFNLILRNGVRVVGYVDFSTQYRSEGLSWMDEQGHYLSSYTVVGWQKQGDPIGFGTQQK